MAREQGQTDSKNRLQNTDASWCPLCIFRSSFFFVTSLGAGATSLHDFRSDPAPAPSRSCPPLARDVHPSQLHPEQDTFLDSRDPVWPLEAKGGVDRGSVFFALSLDITENAVEREEEGDCDSSGVRSSAFVFPATQTQSHIRHHRVSVRQDS